MIEVKAVAVESRTAAHIAHLVNQPLDLTLFHLRQLEEAGLIRSWVDLGSVVRWERND